MSKVVTPEPVSDDALLPIREVVRLTGINPVTLRAWERRYGLIQPVRTEGGHRLYSQRDVAIILETMSWAERGVAVSKVGSILGRAADVTELPDNSPSTAPINAEWHELQGLVQQAVERFDDVRLDQLYGQIFSTYPLSTVFEGILLPVWHRLNQSPGFGQISQWLFFDSFLRARVLQRLHIMRQPGRAPVLLAALSPQCHEFEMLVTGLFLGGSDGGVRVLPLEQPFDELALVCQGMRPQALVLFADTLPTQVQLRQLRRLVMAVDCPLALAGVGADMLEDGLKGSAIANLGGAARLMSQRLNRFLEGHLDT